MNKIPLSGLIGQVVDSLNAADMGSFRDVNVDTTLPLTGVTPTKGSITAIAAPGESFDGMDGQYLYFPINNKHLHLLHIDGGLYYSVDAGGWTRLDSSGSGSGSGLTERNLTNVKLEDDSFSIHELTTTAYYGTIDSISAAGSALDGASGIYFHYPLASAGVIIQFVYPLDGNANPNNNWVRVKASSFGTWTQMGGSGGATAYPPVYPEALKMEGMDGYLAEVDEVDITPYKIVFNKPVGWGTTVMARYAIATCAMAQSTLLQAPPATEIRITPEDTSLGNIFMASFSTDVAGALGGSSNYVLLQGEIGGGTLSIMTDCTLDGAKHTPVGITTVSINMADYPSISIACIPGSTPNERRIVSNIGIDFTITSTGVNHIGTAVAGGIGYMGSNAADNYGLTVEVNGGQSAAFVPESGYTGNGGYTWEPYILRSPAPTVPPVTQATMDSAIRENSIVSMDIPFVLSRDSTGEHYIYRESYRTVIQTAQYLRGGTSIFSSNRLFLDPSNYIALEFRRSEYHPAMAVCFAPSTVNAEAVLADDIGNPQYHWFICNNTRYSGLADSFYHIVGPSLNVTTNVDSNASKQFNVIAFNDGTNTIVTVGGHPESDATASLPDDLRVWIVYTDESSGSKSIEFSAVNKRMVSEVRIDNMDMARSASNLWPISYANVDSPRAVMPVTFGDQYIPPPEDPLPMLWSRKDMENLINGVELGVYPGSPSGLLIREGPYGTVRTLYSSSKININVWDLSNITNTKVSISGVGNATWKHSVKYDGVESVSNSGTSTEGEFEIVDAVKTFSKGKGSLSIEILNLGEGYARITTRLVGIVDSGGDKLMEATAEGLLDYSANLTPQFFYIPSTSNYARLRMKFS